MGYKVAALDKFVVVGVGADLPPGTLRGGDPPAGSKGALFPDQLGGDVFNALAGIFPFEVAAQPVLHRCTVGGPGERGGEYELGPPGPGNPVHFGEVLNR